jgi:hypothetical protein
MERVEKDKRRLSVICGEIKWSSGKCRREDVVAMNWKVLERVSRKDDQFMSWRRKSESMRQ